MHFVRGQDSGSLQVVELAITDLRLVMAEFVVNLGVRNLNLRQKQPERKTNII